MKAISRRWCQLHERHKSTGRVTGSTWRHFLLPSDEQLYSFLSGSVQIKTTPTQNRKKEIRSVELGVCPMQLFHFWSRDAHPVKNLLIFHWDMAIYRFSKWRPSAILELFYHHTKPPKKSLLLASAACQISCQSDTQIWRYSYLNFLHIWLEMLIQAPKMGVLGDFAPLNVTIHHRDPKMRILA